MEGSGQCECRPEFLPPNCDQCNAGYYGYPQCRPCDCHANGTQGRVCQVNGGQCPCRRYYEGKNCDRCSPGYYGFPDCRRECPNRHESLSDNGPTTQCEKCVPRLATRPHGVCRPGVTYRRLFGCGSGLQLPFIHTPRNI